MPGSRSRSASRPCARARRSRLRQLLVEPREDHRVDGREALVGGHNLWTEDYLLDDPVHDLSMQVRGPAAASASRFADRLWQYRLQQSRPEGVDLAGELCPARASRAYLSACLRRPDGSAPARAACRSWRRPAGRRHHRGLRQPERAGARSHVRRGAQDSIHIVQQDLGFTLRPRRHAVSREHARARWSIPAAWSTTATSTSCCRIRARSARAAAPIRNDVPLADAGASVCARWCRGASRRAIRKSRYDDRAGARSGERAAVRAASTWRRSASGRTTSWPGGTADRQPHQVLDDRRPRLLYRLGQHVSGQPAGVRLHRRRRSRRRDASCSTPTGTRSGSGRKARRRLGRRRRELHLPRDRAVEGTPIDGSRRPSPDRSASRRPRPPR